MKKGMTCSPRSGFSGSAGRFVKKVPMQPKDNAQAPKLDGFKCGGKVKSWK